RGDRYNETRARSALGLEALVRGDIAATLEWLGPAERMLAESGVLQPNLFRVHADLIEAQARAGRTGDGCATLERLRSQAELTGSAWAAAAAGRCDGLLAENDKVEEHFSAALSLHESFPDLLELARTQLCYGERLRRLRHRRRAREQLHAALETFDRLGARPWAERARAELRASGERLRRGRPGGQEQLT